MTQEVTQMLCNHMRNALLDATSQKLSIGSSMRPSKQASDSEGSSSDFTGSLFNAGYSSPQLANCIREFRMCCASLPIFELPEETREQLTNLTYDLRRSALLDVLKTTRSLIQNFSQCETWQVDISDTCGAITQLVSLIFLFRLIIA
ncbi:hypothetical protein Ciccas_006420 [Cichlidogyrus casuarinus]|uniref:Exocyst complex component EXOC2/Sec5 N-terminal domain-containing protein n=1 Tax=Cichlidogyrus casuarinus TaxID=1844966 RepID=A0ABD2Q5Z5_9PLAT